MQSKKDSLVKETLLIDTSFLLPALGIRVEKKVFEAIKMFYNYRIYYTQLNILEAMWVALKKLDFENSFVVKKGLESIGITYEQIDIKPEHYIKSWEVYHKAHKDFIDATLYSIAVIEDIKFLTIDKMLIENLKKAGYSTKNIITPDDLISKNKQ